MTKSELCFKKKFRRKWKNFIITMKSASSTLNKIWIINVSHFFPPTWLTKWYSLTYALTNIIINIIFQISELWMHLSVTLKLYFIFHLFIHINNFKCMLVVPFYSRYIKFLIQHFNLYKIILYITPCVRKTPISSTF